MDFTELEIVEIEALCETNPLVKRMWGMLTVDDSDVGEKFLRSVRSAASAISEELDCIHSGRYSKYRILNSSPQVYKRVFQLLSNSKKISEGLVGARGGVIKDMVVDKDMDGMSLTDRLAENKKIK